MKQAALLAVLLFFASALPAQSPLQQRYTVEDGLAMTETMDVAQDPLGYLWVTSTNGRLSRFDGIHWKAYPPEVQFGSLDNLSDGQVIAYRQASNGASKHAILRGDSILYLKGLPASVYRGSNFSGDGYYYFSSPDSVFRINPNSLQQDSVFALRTPKGNYNRIQVEVLSDSILLAKCNTSGTFHGRWYATGAKAGQAFATVSPPNFLPIDSTNFLGWTKEKPVLELYGNDFTSLQKIDLSSYFHPNGRLFTVVQLKGNFYVTERIERSGSRPIDKLKIYGWSPQNPRELKPYTSINLSSRTGQNWIISSDGSLWISGHSGMRRILMNTKAFYEGTSEMISSLHAIGQLPSGEIIMGGYGSGFTVYRGDSLTRLVSPPWNSTFSVMPGSFRSKEGKVVFGADGATKTLAIISSLQKINYHSIKNKVRETPLAGYHFSRAKLPASTPILNKHSTGKDSIDFAVYGMVGGFVREDSPQLGQFALIQLPLSDPPQWTLVTQAKGIRVRNVLCTAQDKAGRIWFGHTSTGIGVYDPARDTAVTWVAERAGDPGAISMVIDKKDRLWFGARDGLYYIEEASSIALQPSPHLRSRPKKCFVREIPDSYVPSLLLKGDTLIVGHTGGVSILDVRQDDVSEPLVQTINLLKYSLGACEQNALLIDDDGSLWVGADAGAVKLDFSLFGRGRRMQAKAIRAVESNTGPVAPDNKNHYRFPLADRSLFYGFDLPIHDRFQDNIRADILLRNQQKDTLDLYTDVNAGDMLRYPQLPPGNYHLEHLLYSNNQLVDRLEATIRIPPALRERWWFWLACFALIALPIMLILRSRAIKAKTDLEREQLNNQLTRAELNLANLQRENSKLQASTLSNAVNPHFISNAITWLQSAYYVGRPIGKMQEMADKLSKTIRTMFTNATDGRASHSIEEELLLVERYLRTVNIQYDERYDFQLPAAAEVERYADYQVLLMQVQVHTENAVEHGLRYRPKGRNITISLREENSFLYISIEDNGAGVDYVKEKQKEMEVKPGKGTTIMERLQGTFNDFNQEKIVTEVISPTQTDEKGHPFGTEIIISIPKTYRYAIESPGN